ncbi:MAG: biopolymer transporter ExbD [Planctomycetaceae bacterium]|nr:MAG: biopolymer transporter ExbD [Planctomycetaceae bacterium]
MNEMHQDEEMQPLLRSKTYDDSEMDITPMIDMTFLLLIFFLVASKMDPSAAISLPPARYGMPIVEKGAVIITLALGQDGSAIVYAANGLIPDALVDGSDIEAQEDEIAAYVEQELMQSGAERKENVLIKAERGIKHREVARITRAATRPEGVGQLYIAVLEVQQ